MNAPVDLYELFGAETLQRNDEQAEADSWAAIYAIGFTCFGAGCVFTGLVWVISWFI